MRRALLIALALAAILLIAVPPAALYYAAFTESGLELVARLIPRRMGNVEVVIEGVRGTVERGIRIERLEIDDTHVHLRFEGVSGEVVLAPLLLQTVHVAHVTIRRALIDVRRPPPGESHQPPWHWHFVPHWLEIRADDVRVGAGTLIVPDGQRFDATELSAAGIVRSSTVRIDRAAMTLDELRVSAHGLLHAANPLRLDAAALATIRPARGPAWVIDAAGRGDLNDLAVTAHFAAPLRAGLSGHALDLTRRWRWQGTAHVEDFDLRAWGGGSALGAMHGDLAVTADPSGFTARGPLTAPGLNAGAIAVDCVGAYADRVFTLRRLDLTHPSGAQVSARGEIGIVAHGPRLDLQGSWRRFRWPLAAKAAPVTSASGQFLLHGVRPYDLQGSGELAIRGLEPIGFDLEGALDDTALQVRAASLRAFDGRAQVAGRIAWSPRASWSASGTAVDMNPVSLRPDLPGRLTFDFEAAGSRLAGRSADFSVTVRRLTGQLRRLHAQAEGTIARHGLVWRLERVRAQLARTALSADGTVDDRIDLDFHVAGDDLTLFDPQLVGRLDARGTLHGPRTSPAVAAVVTGSGLRFRGFSAASLAAHIDFDPGRGSAKSDLEAHGLALGRRKLGELAFVLDGPSGSQRATLSIAGPDFRASALATGALLDGSWRGALTQLDVSGTDTQLALDAPTAILASADSFRLDRMCLSGKPARMCADGEWSPHAWSVFALASGLPLQLLTDGLTTGVQYRGLIGLTAQLGASDRGPVQGRLGMTLSAAERVSRSGDGHLETIRLGSGTLSLNAAADRVDGELDIGGGAAGSVDGRLTLHRTAAAWRDTPLEGSLNVHAPLNEWAPLYTRRIDRVAGDASAKLALAGTLGTPLLNGTLSVQGGELDLYDYNLEMRAVAIGATLAGNGIDFEGAARIGAGAATARGHLEWRGGETFGRFTLGGSNLRVVDIPEAQIDASPDLLFALEGRALKITGTVKVPSARIAPAGLTNAVQVSPDQVIVGEESDGAGGRLQVSTQIGIELGDQVRVDTQGLKGRLTGRVLVTSGGESITRASGELRIADGEYSAYGRQLDIDRGRLIYTASPLDNPGIDIRAVKRFHDPNVGATLAGINVRGTLRRQEITFFSEPPLAQQQIMSLVFAGGTLFGGPQLGASAASNTSRSENAQLIGQGAAVLGSQIGLPVGIEPTYNNDTALMLGKYLSPRLYVSYGITLLQSLNIVKLRYTLGDHWALSTEFGQLGGADVVYTFQK